jgi:hypothetical protein
MPCETRGGMVVCSRKPGARCHECGKPVTALCDATKKDGTICDMPMCDEHRHRVGKDVDVCKYHNHPKYIKTAINNRKKLKEVEAYFIEQYKKASFRVVPGHWPEFKSKEEVDKWIAIYKKR